MRRFNPSPERNLDKNGHQNEDKSLEGSESNITPFGGGHAFRTIQTPDNSYEANNNFVSYLRNFQRNNSNPPTPNNGFPNICSHEGNCNQLSNNSLLSLGLPPNSTSCST